MQRRLAREAKDKVHGPVVNTPKGQKKPKVNRIGKPGYKFERDSKAKTLKFEIYLEHILPDVTPLHRIMSSFEQKKEIPDNKYQYLLIAAEPYTTIAFKIPNLKIDKSEGRYFFNWDTEKKVFSLFLSLEQAKRGASGRDVGSALPKQQGIILGQR